MESIDQDVLGDFDGVVMFFVVVFFPKRRWSFCIPETFFYSAAHLILHKTVKSG